MKPVGLIVRRSQYTHSETLERLIAAIAEHGATVFTVIDHAANAAGVGLELPLTSVVVFGNPEVGTPLMQTAPDMAIELPSRVLVRSTAASSTEVVYVDPVSLAERHRLDDVSGLTGLVQIVDQVLGG